MDRKETYEESSKKRLLTITSKKIDTTMIGAINAIEKEFVKELSDPDFYDKFQQVRSKILDNGNNQKRNLAEEFEQYDIHWNRYTIVMPVKPRRME
jgi:hypothetical protein